VVVREADLWQTWVPFMSSSELLHQYKPLDRLVRFNLKIPFLYR
jgi:hypothetical protein